MEKTIGELRKSLEGHEARISRLEKLIVSISVGGDKEKAGGKKLAVKEFLILKNAQSDVQKTLTIGYYLENREHLSPFNTDDLRKGFSAAKEPLPSNVNAFINQNIKNGHIMEAHEKKDNKKAWTLTATGERFVENNFVSEAGGKHGSRIK